MAKRYNSNWDAKKLIISFNQKQWRQDFASFVRENRFWNMTRVTRSRAISNNPLDKGIKSFEVYDQYGRSVQVTYKDDNSVISSTDEEIVKKYFEERGM